MLGIKKFDSSHSAWGGTTTTCQFFSSELGRDLRQQDLQLTVDALNGDTWTVSVLVSADSDFRVYNDNGGAGFDDDGIVLIDDIQVIGVKIDLAGGNAAAPAVVVNHRRRGV